MTENIDKNINVKEVLNIEEIAGILNISKQSAYCLARRADFPVIRISRKIIVSKKAFFSWLENTNDNF